MVFQKIKKNAKKLLTIFFYDKKAQFCGSFNQSRDLTISREVFAQHIRRERDTITNKSTT